MGLFDLFKPAWQSKNYAKAEKAVKKLTNQEILADIAKHNSSDILRATAVGNLNSQSILSEIAKSETNSHVCRALIEKLTDQEALAYIAHNNCDKQVRIKAVDKLTDQKMLADVAKNSTEYRFREVSIEAVKKLTDQRILADVATNGKEYDTRIIAIKKLTDPNVLAYIAKNDVNINLCKAAVCKLTVQETLIDVAKNAKFDDIRIEATKKLINKTLVQEIYAEIIMRGNRGFREALSLLSDENILENIVRQTQNNIVKNEVLRKLGGFFCFSCGTENRQKKEQLVSCICCHCQAENHEFVHRSDTIVTRDEERGPRWNECKWCGIKKDSEIVNIGSM